MTEKIQYVVEVLNRAGLTAARERTFTVVGYNLAYVPVLKQVEEVKMFRPVKFELDPLQSKQVEILFTFKLFELLLEASSPKDAPNLEKAVEIYRKILGAKNDNQVVALSKSWIKVYGRRRFCTRCWKGCQYRAAQAALERDRYALGRFMQNVAMTMEAHRSGQTKYEQLERQLRRDEHHVWRDIAVEFARLVAGVLEGRRFSEPWAGLGGAVEPGLPRQTAVQPAQF